MKQSDAVKILKLNPKKIKILIGMVSMMWEVGEYQKAIECFDKALKIRDFGARNLRFRKF